MAPKVMQPRPVLGRNNAKHCWEATRRLRDEPSNLASGVDQLGHTGWVHPNHRLAAAGDSAARF